MMRRAFAISALALVVIGSVGWFAGCSGQYSFAEAIDRAEISRFLTKPAESVGNEV